MEQNISYSSDRHSLDSTRPIRNSSSKSTHLFLDNFRDLTKRLKFRFELKKSIAASMNDGKVREIFSQEKLTLISRDNDRGIEKLTVLIDQLLVAQNEVFALCRQKHSKSL